MTLEPSDPSAGTRPTEPAEEPSLVRCARHPEVETGLRCGRCDTPICPRCLVLTPVGARCRDCARLRRLPLFEAAPRHYLLAVLAGVFSAALGAVALLFLPAFGFLTLLLYLALGYGVGEAVSLATNRKRATGLAVVAAGCAGLGALAPALLRLSPPLAVLAIALAGAGAWGRMR